MGWTYIGHGEWVQLDTDDTARGHNNQLHTEPMWVQKWLEKNDKDIALHMAVTRRDTPIGGEQNKRLSQGGTYRNFRHG